VHEGNHDTGIIIVCNDLAPSAGRQPVPASGQLTLSDDASRQFTTLKPAKEVVVVEHLPQLCGADDACGRSGHGCA
jgi:hypothetical protein